MAIWNTYGNFYTKPYHVVLCRHPNVGNTTDFQILNISAASTALPAYPTAEAMEIVSASDEDGGAGTDTGMLTARIFYLDGTTGSIASLTVTLNGTTAVALSDTSITRVLGIHGLTFGSAGAAVGIVTVREATGDVNRMGVEAKYRSAAPGRYTVPNGYRAFYRGFDLEHSTHGTAPAEVDYIIRADVLALDGTLTSNNTFELDVGTSGPSSGKAGGGAPTGPLGYNFPLPAGTTISALARTDTAGLITVAGRIYLELVSV